VSSRGFIAVFIAVAVLTAGFYFYRNFEKGKAPNVATEPVGGRTAAQPDTSAPIAVSAPGDPLLPGTPEVPDIPPDAAHSKIKKAGQRIREAVLADGTVGDHETPGIDFTGLSQKQRNWYLNEAIAITCSCGCRQDLLECRRDDATCPISPGLSDSLLAEARKR
jgi:hypothetical protein